MRTIVLLRTTAMLFAAVGLGTLPAVAVDFSYSGFGTLGYAKSDRPYAYQRFITDRGTLMRDSLIGVQVDARLDPQIGATLQWKAQPSLSNDHGYDATLAWAFVSYRPTNDWLFRAGKLRVPLYLYSENTDIGATFDFARLPAEMYSISPTTDLVGVSFRKNWSLSAGELSLDGFWGKTKLDIRFYGRDDLGPARPAGAIFVPIDLSANGFALTLRRNNDSFRFGFNHAVAKRADGGQISRYFPFVSLAPGVGYYQFQGPDVPTTGSTSNTAIALGAEVGVGAGVRVIGEYARRIIHDSKVGPDGAGGYVSLLKRVGRWTPYLTYAYLLSSSGPRNIYNAVNDNRVPAFIPGAAAINASQRAGADGIPAFDQRSVALGTSYSFNATSKIKAEYQRTHNGQMSYMVDAPAGSDIRNQNVNVYSLSYSFEF